MINGALTVGTLDETVFFDNDIENESALADSVVVYLANPPALPPGWSWSPTG